MGSMERPETLKPELEMSTDHDSISGNSFAEMRMGWVED